MRSCSESGQLNEALNEIAPHEMRRLIYDWQLWAHDDQLAPLSFAPSDSLLFASGDSPSSSLPPDAALSGRLEERESEGATKMRVWIMLGGRGSGKTRAGAEWVRGIACGYDGAPRAAAGSRNESRREPPKRIALVGKTIHDVRTVMVEGVSGLLSVHPGYERPLYEPSKRRITWKNGAIAEMFSADEAEALRGPQFSHAWCDELAKWRDAEAAWDMLQFGLRLGDHPQVVVTTTPRPSAFLKKIMSDAATVTTQLATAGNALNLAPSFLTEMTRRYAGTTLGRQELLGEIVEDTAESLWRRSWIESSRIASPPEMRRVIVALDPPVTSTAQSDACGIIVAGLGVDGRAYVLADRTIQGRTPDVWAKAAIAAYDDFSADRMVAEVNQGGDLVLGVVHQFRKNLPVVKVRATRGKWVRAEPVASLYAEGRVVHVGRFDALEDQLVAFGIDGTVRGKSPDRADALVWAVTELLLSDGVKPGVRML
ncbi:MAG: terminase family protein [Hyphomicrobium sp.]